MTFVRISGIKLVRANGSIYRYHRATGKRIASNPDTQPEAFFAEVKLLEAEAMAKASAQFDPMPAHLGGLFALYRASPEFTQLEKVTQDSYQRAMNALKTFDAKGVPKIRRPKKLGVANKAWRPAEVDAFFKATYDIPFGGSGLRKAVALAYYGGLRKEDVVRVPKTARSGGSMARSTWT